VVDIPIADDLRIAEQGAEDLGQELPLKLLLLVREQRTGAGAIRPAGRDTAMVIAVCHISGFEGFPQQAGVEQGLRNCGDSLRNTPNMAMHDNAGSSSPFSLTMSPNDETGAANSSLQKEIECIW